MSVSRPILRYHGGKWKLADWIVGHFPAHRVYVEPFGGAASVLLRKPRSYAEIYNEIDGEIVNLFRVVRDQVTGDALRRALELTPFSRIEFDASYEADCDAVERARRTVIRSFMGFGSAGASGLNTGFRSNSNRSGTTPAHDWKNFPDIVPSFVERMRGVVIENAEAQEVMKQHDAVSTLHYVDPPYPESTRKSFNKGYRFEMTDDQHATLLETLDGLRGYVVLSGYACDLYDNRLGHWTRFERAAMADGARPRTEVLWINPACEHALRRGKLAFA